MSATGTGAVIAGIGHTEYSKNSGRSEMQLAAEASIAAIRDSWLEPSQIDGMVTFTIDENDEHTLMRNLGLTGLRFTARTPGGGGGSAATIQLAAAAVASGAANAVLVYRAFNERSGRRFGQPTGVDLSSLPPKMSWVLPYGVDTPAKMYSLWYQRYMHTYGVSNEDFGRYSVVARKHAATNPNAWFYKRPITLEDHQSSRWIVEPILRLLDCCQESDGGVAFVVTSEARAKYLPSPLVRIVAAEQSHLQGVDELLDYYRGDRAMFPEADELARRLYAASELGPQDIDVALIYENFSPVVFMQLESFGFCGRGEAKDFIADGEIELGGAIPVNTNGGLLGEGYIHGLNNIVEAVRQIRGNAANQVAGAQNVLVSAGRSGLVLSKG
jgi:acetyl-CoA acetyltransferase